MSSQHEKCKQRRVPRSWLALLACSALAACGTASHDADPDSSSAERSVSPPNSSSMSSSTSTPMSSPMTPSMQAQGTDAPKPNPGGQSGSDSGGSTACAETNTPIALDDTTPWGLTLAELDAQASDRLAAQGVALIWTVGGWQRTALYATVEFEADGAILAVSTTPWCIGDRILQPAHLHLRSDDGLLDQSIDVSFQANGDDSTFSISMSGELTGDQLKGSALEQALIERGGIDGLSALDRFDTIDLTLNYGLMAAEQGINGSMQLWLRDDESGTGTTLIDLAGISSSEPLPSPRVAIDVPATLAGSCDVLSATLPLEPPNVSYDERLPLLAGTWVLCGGDHAEPIAIDYVGVKVADDGSFVHVVQATDGSLRERHGFTHEGHITINDAVMGGLDPTNFVIVRSVMVRDLLLNTSAGMVGSAVHRIELSSDRRTMRWFTDSDGDSNLELVFQKSDLPVSAEPSSSFTDGERAGASACTEEERDLQPASSLAAWQDVIGGSWTWCSGAPGDATGGTLELDAVGGFRQLDASGKLASQGAYELLPGNPPEVHYLQLTPEGGGTPLVMFGMLSSRTPRKLLAVMDTGSGNAQLAVLSAMP